MIPISVCIITKNEEKNIEKCLAPLVPYGFEIIVVDTGSTDKTKEIAAKYTDKIYDFEWIDDFSAARNFSLKKASHNYVLVVDSDEFLIELDMEGLQKAIEEHPRDVGLILRNNYSDPDGMTNNFPDRVERLFHKRYYYYKYRIHEQVTNIQTDGTYYGRYDIPFTVNHVGYLGSDEEKLAKAERNNALLFKEIEQHPDDPYFYFQVAQSYNLIDDYENAYIYYKKAIELPLIVDQLWVQVMAASYINAMNNTERYNEAILFFEKCYDDFATNAAFFNNLGNSYLRANQPLKAMMEYVKATQCPVAYEEGSNTYYPYYNIGYINEMMGNIPAAISFYKRAIVYPLAKERLAMLGVSEEEICALTADNGNKT